MSDSPRDGDGEQSETGAPSGEDPHPGGSTDGDRATEGDGTDAANASEADRADPDAPVDYAWVMQVTFVTTIVVGVPVVAVLSAFVRLPTWESRVGFAARVGAVVWILVALSVYGYARRERPTSGR